MRREYCWCDTERVRSVHPIRGTYVWVCTNCDCYSESNYDLE